MSIDNTFYDDDPNAWGVSDRGPYTFGQVLADARLKVCSAAMRLAEADRDSARAKLERLRTICADQAEDEGLWFRAQHITEAHLQDALRELHRAIEGET